MKNRLHTTPKNLKIYELLTSYSPHYFEILEDCCITETYSYWKMETTKCLSIY
jgi:hypothetical protein